MISRADLMLIIISSIVLPSSISFFPATKYSVRLWKTNVFQHRRSTAAPKIMKLARNDNMADDDDETFYNDLRKAKKEMLGSPIPLSEDLQEETESSENEFLKAMNKATQEFQTAKEELGSEGACDLFLGKIQEEDKRMEREEKGEMEGFQ
mmetsp:Transcript_18249/g.23922  ORF Transcript_18249/g.23922 Transcript_18249/m.23922 type:complete len:151 (-) Transcript_18249:2253-2705(-)